MAQQEYSIGELRNYSRVVEIVQSSDVIGSGTQEDPKRSLLRYWEKDGSSLIAAVDPLQVAKARAIEEEKRAKLAQMAQLEAEAEAKPAKNGKAGKAHHAAPIEADAVQVN